MKADPGPFAIPKKPANFDGAQWAPEVFKPFEIKVPVYDGAARRIKSTPPAAATVASWPGVLVRALIQPRARAATEEPSTPGHSARAHPSPSVAPDSIRSARVCSRM